MSDSRESRTEAKENKGYVICGTPRTRSTFLCALLKSTGVAGIPESYFREPDEPTWATQWGITRTGDETFSAADYVRAAFNAGRTENGIFGVRVMWGSMEPLVDKLRVIYPNEGGNPLDLLERAFGGTRFVHLRRENVLAQAISWLRAEQTTMTESRLQVALREFRKHPGWKILYKAAERTPKPGSVWM